MSIYKERFFAVSDRRLQPGFFRIVFAEIGHGFSPRQM